MSLSLQSAKVETENSKRKKDTSTSEKSSDGSSDPARPEKGTKEKQRLSVNFNLLI